MPDGASRLPARTGPWPPRTRWPDPLHRAVAEVRRVLAGHPGPALVALSGGADSLALAAACAVLAGTREGQCQGPVGAVVVDHGLQPGSDAVARAAADLARGLGLAPVTTARVQVARTGDGPEAEARDARRSALAAAAGAAGAPGRPALVLTAHTADDQAEQVLLGIARGSGTRSLAGVPTWGTLPDGAAVARPLLGLTRADTEAVCRWAGLAWWEDPHNADPALLRSRVRTRVLPVLEDPREGLGPGVRAALVRTAAIAAEDADALDGWAAEEYSAVRVRGTDGDGNGPCGDGRGRAAVTGAPGRGDVGAPVVLDLARLAGLPAAVRHRVLALAAGEAGAPRPSRERVLAVDRLVTEARRGGGSAGPVQLGAGVEVVRRPAAGGCGTLVLTPAARP